MAVLSIAILKMYEDLDNKMKWNSEKQTEKFTIFKRFRNTYIMGFFPINFIKTDVWQHTVKDCYVDPSFQFNLMG